MLPAAYAWLDRELSTYGHPRMLVEMVKLFGVHEAPGAADNPTILGWAREIGLGAVYRHDSVAWCGLTVAIAAHRADWPVPSNPLWALNWAAWGKPVDRPMLGDVLTFTRDGGGHVALYVAEDATAYHILGGNQGDKVCIERKAKASLHAARRAPYHVQPKNIRVVHLSAAGAPSGLTEA